MTHCDFPGQKQFTRGVSCAKVKLALLQYIDQISLKYKQQNNNFIGWLKSINSHNKGGSAIHSNHKRGRQQIYHHTHTCTTHVIALRTKPLFIYDLPQWNTCSVTIKYTHHYRVSSVQSHHGKEAVMINTWYIKHNRKIHTNCLMPTNQIKNNNKKVN